MQKGVCPWFAIWRQGMKTKMASSLVNQKKFSIDDAFEEGYDESIRVYGSTTERSPLKPKDKNMPVEDNVSVWIENPHQQRLHPAADDVMYLFISLYLS